MLLLVLSSGGGPVHFDSSLLLQSLCGVAFCSYFFFNDTATSEIYTLSLHDALPIRRAEGSSTSSTRSSAESSALRRTFFVARSEEHTSELQSRQYLVCRLLLEKKKQQKFHPYTTFPTTTVNLGIRHKQDETDIASKS